MSINIGLVVHDKINLQNAVDLGAYYAAARQAEILNAVAHQNYQIRQAYKLLSWRYNVLGGVGTQRGRSPTSGPRTTEVWPTVSCVQDQNYWEKSVVFKGQDELCTKGRRYQEIPNLDFSQPLKAAFLMAPWNPISWLVYQSAERHLEFAQSTCQQYAAMNWLFNMVALTSYRWQQAQRRALIAALEKNLQRPISQDEGAVDLQGGSIYEGVKNTIERNLTQANFNSQPVVEVFNPLQNAQARLLPPIFVWLNATYMYLNNNCSGKAPRHINNLPSDMQLVEKLGLLELQKFVQTSEPELPHWGMTLGVEKNPWLMVYVGVKATTKPRQLFWPLGRPVTMTATAFAKPFGGRVGPWYGRVWPQGAAESSRQNLFETLFPVQRGGADEVVRYSPRAPRYPGDGQGLQWQEKRHQDVLRTGLQGLAFKARHLDYFRLLDTETWQSPRQREMDALVWGPVKSDTRVLASSYPRFGGVARVYELRSVVPDLFDVTYYSIDPNSWPTYQSHIQKNREALGVPDKVPVLHDVGYRDPKLWSPAHNSHWSKVDFGVKDQMAIVGLYQARPVLASQEYRVPRWEHVLTNWVHPHKKDARFVDVENRFAACDVADEVRPEGVQTVPGACIMGGRSGYSVKLINRQQLLGSQFSLGGGEGGEQGSILNPPPEEF